MMMVNPELELNLSPPNLFCFSFVSLLFCVLCASPSLVHRRALDNKAKADKIGAMQATARVSLMQGLTRETFLQGAFLTPLTTI